MTIKIDKQTSKLLREIDVLSDELGVKVPLAEQRLRQELLPAIGVIRTLLGNMVYTGGIATGLMARSHRATIGLDDALYLRLRRSDINFPLNPPRDFNARLVIEFSEADDADGTVALELTVKLVTGLIDERLRQQVDREAANLALKLGEALETSVRYESTASFPTEPSPDSE